MTPTEILVATRALIAEPEHWCQKQSQHTLGRTIQRCLSYALECVGGDIAEVTLAYAAIAQHVEIGLVHFNDTHTHAEVIGLLDQVIAENQT